MKKLIWAVLLLWCSFSFGQTTTFNKRVDAGYPFLNLTKILPTDSCYYVVGAITDTTGGATVGCLFLKLSLEGETIWQNPLGSPQKFFRSWGSGLFAVGDTSFVTMGHTTDSISKSVIYKYNLEGDTIFTKEFFSPFYPEENFISAANSIHPVNDTSFSALAGVNGLPGGANIEIYWIRLHESGSIINSKVFSGPLQNIPMSQVIRNGEEIIIGSGKNNLGQVSENFTYRSYLLSIDLQGNINWQYSTPSVDLSDNANALLPIPDGGLIIGTGKGVETASNSSSGRVDWNPCFFKLNADRQMEWVREFRGRTMGPIYAIVKIAQATDSSGYLGVSRIADFESAEEPLNGMWVMKVSNAGDSLWARHFTLINEEPGMPEPMDLKATPDGGYIVCGAIDPPDDGGVHPLRYGWLLKLDEHGCLVPGCHLPNSTAVEPGTPPQLALFPNPARDFINFELRGARPAPDGAFRILDAKGRLLQSKPAREALGTVVVPVQDWAAGAYVVQYLEGGQLRATEQFLKVE